MRERWDMPEPLTPDLCSLRFICFTADLSFVSFHTAGHCMRVCSELHVAQLLAIDLPDHWCVCVCAQHEGSVKPVWEQRVKISVLMWIAEWMCVWMEMHTPLTCQIPFQQLFNWGGKGQQCVFPTGPHSHMTFNCVWLIVRRSWVFHHPFRFHFSGVTKYCHHLLLREIIAFHSLCLFSQHDVRWYNCYVSQLTPLLPKQIIR